jgi:hypothetical protein
MTVMTIMGVMPAAATIAPRCLETPAQIREPRAALEGCGRHSGPYLSPGRHPLPAEQQKLAPPRIIAAKEKPRLVQGIEVWK